MNKPIKKLNSNGYAYYRTFEYWEPLEASAVVCGLDPETIDYKAMPANVEHVYKLLERAFYQNSLKTTEIGITNVDKCVFLEQYSSSFFWEKNYGGDLCCVHAIKLIHCLKYKMKIEVPSELELEYYIPF